MSSLDKDVPLPDTKPKGTKMQEKTLAQERAAPPVHETRAYDVWTDEAVHAVEDKPWVRPTSLEAPPARPGFEQRWIRVNTRGEEDTTNASRKFREGWRPRPAETVPASYSAPTIAHGKWAGCVGVEGMLLCEMPRKLHDKKKAAVRAQTDNITNALEVDLQKQSNTMMPITQQRSSRVVREVKIKED